MIPFFLGFLTCLSAFFRSRYSLGLEIIALRQQVGRFKRSLPRPRMRIQDRIFWILLRCLWPAWSQVLIIVNQKPWSPGIALAFVCSGAFDRGARARAGQRSIPRCELSSSG